MREHSEPERVDRAVREAVDLIDAGDKPLVATDYVSREHEVSHRYRDILERVRNHIGPDEYYVTENGHVLHTDPECAEDTRPATDAEIRRLRTCLDCEVEHIPALEDAGGEAA
jgi:hypothetical protein